MATEIRKNVKVAASNINNNGENDAVRVEDDLEEQKFDLSQLIVTKTVGLETKHSPIGPVSRSDIPKRKRRRMKELDTTMRVKIAKLASSK